VGSFPDHFSAVAATYARYRPTYPAQLFDWIADVAPARNAAWDCGAGSGQATVALAERFARVVATDASAEQLSQAPAHPRITWCVAPAEASGLDPLSMDAVTVAQALHWFDLPRFWREVRRVVRPSGVVAAWSYGTPFLTDTVVTGVLRDFHDNVVGPYWPIERGMVDTRYQTMDFPFDRLSSPGLDLRATWVLDELTGYLRSWSATRRYIEERGIDPVTAFSEALRRVWGNGSREVIWPLTILAGRV
jgi:SAM-dependent methyltransferase